MGNIIKSTIHVQDGEDDDNINDCSAALSLIEENDYWLDKLRIGNSNGAYTESGQVDMILPRDLASLIRLGDALGSNRNLRSLCLDCSDELRATANANAEAPPPPPTEDRADNNNVEDDAPPSSSSSPVGGGTMSDLDRRAILLDGIRRNKSIRRPVVWGRDRPLEDGAGFEILDAFAAHSANYTRFEMWRCGLGGGGGEGGGGSAAAAACVVASFLGGCVNLVEVKMTSCRIDRGQLMHLAGPASPAGLRRLAVLDLDGNDVGSTGGCDVVAGLLRDPACALRVLRLGRNGIDGAGASILASSLAGNVDLEELHLGGNPGMSSAVGIGAFSRLLCDVSTVNATYLSNHTLSVLGMMVPPSAPPEFRRLEEYLRLNGTTTTSPDLAATAPGNSPGGGRRRRRRSDVGTRKVLRYHPCLDVGPLLEYDLKLLPRVVDWFDGAAAAARTATGGGDDDEYNDVVLRKQTALFQFVRDLPLLSISSVSRHRLFKRTIRHCSCKVRRNRVGEGVITGD